MLKPKVVFIIVLLLSGFISGLYVAGAVGSLCTVAAVDDWSDDALPNQMSTINGKMMMIDPETKKEYLPNAATVMFQRVDCKRCVFLASADKDGNYEIRVPKGKYRIIYRRGSRIGETTDALSSDQPRFVEAISYNHPVQFNIKISLNQEPGNK